MSQAGTRGRDPALDRPRLATDICRRVDLPCGAFSINHLVSGRLSTARTKYQLLQNVSTQLTVPWNWPIHPFIDCTLPLFSHVSLYWSPGSCPG